MQVSLRSNCSAHSFFLRLDYQFVFSQTRYSSDAASLDRNSLEKKKKKRDRQDDNDREKTGTELTEAGEDGTETR